MIKKLNATDKETAKKMIDVQLPSYKAEAELIGFYGIPQLNDTVESIMENDEIFIGYFFDEELAAFISYTEEQNEFDICRLVVHPNHFRKGIAKKLLEHVLKNRTNGKKVIVSTGAKNVPAKNLYAFFGFEEVKNIEVAPGIFLTFMELM
ncbi:MULTISPECIES: GNAT family N-acetyltransferase [Bacillus]|uniref:Acetyltransferase n=2 Tax=Bacillus TaxID=1386 RepID=A0A0M4GCD6_9BACI|nr:MULTISPECIES: GNAT family N-acetyltransferase [Bacillus]ALC83603.1 acetyltransferase [Bacillus gobiensis]MBP1082603.1 ribosomal protein S18 acetylase RimI-like enzyme [Bacillus capparidis]MED1097168.1 GNAT family N-acetyltransferase [Bacillus capparidis]